MLTDVANIGEPLSRVKTQERSGCRCEFCFHGYKNLSFYSDLDCSLEMSIILWRQSREMCSCFEKVFVTLQAK